MTNGPRIVGNYTLGALLGRGGTSEVYAATHRFLGDEVAVKMLRPQLASDDAVVAAFVAEAARTREIQHPNVMRVIDFGRDDASGSCFLVMERIAGESLAARLRARGRIEEAELRGLAAAIADGMEAAHARGIVHRDLKPGNVMLRGDRPTIVDFGIAKSLDAGSAVVTNRRVGTLAYMAPEQLAEGLITPAADVWALGVVMYEAATGRLPYENFNDGRLPQLFDTAPRAGSLAEMSAALDALIARCLQRAPGARPTMREVAAALREPVQAERVTEDAGPAIVPRPVAEAPAVAAAGGPSARPVPARRRWWGAGATAAAIVAAAGVAYAVWPSSRPTAAVRQTAPDTTTVTTPVTATETGTAPAKIEPPPATATATRAAPPAPPAPVHRHPKSKRASHRPPATTTQGETLD